MSSNPRPSCESVIDDYDYDEQAKAKKHSTLVDNQKSGPPSPTRPKTKPPSVHSDSGYSSKTSKTGLTSDSSSFNGRSARPLARAASTRERPPPTPYPSATDQTVARVRSESSAHAPAPPSPAASHDLRYIYPADRSSHRKPAPPPQTLPPPPPPPPLTHAPPYYPHSPMHAPSQYGYPANAPAAPPSAFNRPLPNRTRSSSVSRPKPGPIDTSRQPYPSGYVTPMSPGGPSPGSYMASTPQTPSYQQAPGYWVYEPAVPSPSQTQRQHLQARPRSGSVASHSRRRSLYDDQYFPQPQRQAPVVTGERQKLHAAPQYDARADREQMPPPRVIPSRPRTTQPSSELMYPPSSPQRGFSERPDRRPSVSAEDPRQSKEVKKSRKKSEVGMTRPGAAEKTEQKTQEANDYINAQRKKTSQQLTSEALENRDPSPKIVRRASKSQHSRGVSQSGHSITNSEQDRELRIGTDEAGALTMRGVSDHEISVQFGEDGKPSTLTVAGSRSRYYRPDGTNTSKGSKSTFAERAGGSRVSRKRDSGIDADDPRPIARTGSDHST